MNDRGISGFSVVFIILFVMVLAYIGYSIGNVWFRGQSFKEKVKETLRLNPTGSDSYYISKIIRDAKEMGLELSANDIYIDRSIPDSVMAIVEYPDSSVMPIFTYRKLQHLEVIVATGVK
ncbi:MAG TPA: hypothetical protein EYP58_04200 [bacterium (Candidatus Stahlbacteria)]|nr:hypothetical protein [Candidatus Stahlbacteria bacterium]